MQISLLPTCYVPKDGTLNRYRKLVSIMPNSSHPELSVSTPTATSPRRSATKLLFDTLHFLQPQVTSSVSKKITEEEVLELAGKVLDNLPSKKDYESTVKIFAEDNSPLKRVLLQEIERYNIIFTRSPTAWSRCRKTGLVVVRGPRRNIQGYLRVRLVAAAVAVYEATGLLDARSHTAGRSASLMVLDRSPAALVLLFRLHVPDWLQWSCRQFVQHTRGIGVAGVHCHAAGGEPHNGGIILPEYLLDYVAGIWLSLGKKDQLCPPSS